MTLGRQQKTEHKGSLNAKHHSAFGIIDFFCALGGWKGIYFKVPFRPDDQPTVNPDEPEEDAL